MQRNFNPNVNVAQLSQQGKNQSECSKNQQLSSDSLTKPDDVFSDDWYSDSGATNHLTSNIQNLNLGNTKYTGKWVMVIIPKQKLNLKNKPLMLLKEHLRG
jgi:hypothetical protein